MHAELAGVVLSNDMHEKRGGSLQFLVNVCKTALLAKGERQCGVSISEVQQWRGYVCDAKGIVILLVFLFRAETRRGKSPIPVGMGV